MDDSHIFCRPDQLAEEIAGVIDLVRHTVSTFGFEYQAYLATRPLEKSIGSDDFWRDATAALRQGAERAGIPLELDEGGGAFYGPKIDLKLRDAIGREWQCSTIQVDFNLPERFDLNYIGQDGAKHRVVMIHRALFGSLERFFAVLIEHYAGAFPLWLAPVQARVLTISEKVEPWAAKVVETLQKRGFRVDADLSADKVGAKIRRAQLEKIPVMLVCGPKEAEAQSVAPRLRDGGKQLEVMTLEAFERWMEREAAIPRGGNVPAAQNS